MMKDKKQYDQKVKGEWCSLNVQICPRDLTLPCFQLKISLLVVVGKWIHLSQAAGLKFTMWIRLYAILLLIQSIKKIKEKEEDFEA